MYQRRPKYEINCGPVGCLIILVALFFMVQGCNQTLGL